MCVSATQGVTLYFDISGSVITFIVCDATAYSIQWLINQLVYEEVKPAQAECVSWSEITQLCEVMQLQEFNPKHTITLIKANVILPSNTHDAKWVLMLDFDLLKLPYWFSPFLPDGRWCLFSL